MSNFEFHDMCLIYMSDYLSNLNFVELKGYNFDVQFNGNLIDQIFYIFKFYFNLQFFLCLEILICKFILTKKTKELVFIRLIFT